VWKTTPFMALLILAGLQIIGADVYEAAKIDGASKWQTFTRITIPMIKVPLMVAVLFRTLDVLRIYDLPAILTNGGGVSGHATTTLSILVINQIRQGFNSASALSTIVFLIIAFTAFLAIAYATGLPFLAGFCAVIIGALLAFLWYNIPPAKFFMGDTGSLALGATLGVMAMMIDAVFVLPLIGFIFVVEALSIILQLLSKKLRKGKKIFHVAPLHHHFEHVGWTEAQVVMRFWIIGALVAIVGLIIGLLGGDEQVKNKVPGNNPTMVQEQQVFQEQSSLPPL